MVVQDSPGFLVNRVLFPYLLDAAELFESGASAEEIDDALLQWGMPMGPLRLIDEIGVDITVDIADTLEKAYGERDRASEILRKMQISKIARTQSRAGVSTNTKAKSRRLTRRLKNGATFCCHPERSRGIPWRNLKRDTTGSFDSAALRSG